MHSLYYTISWMLFNSMLALIPVIAGIILIKAKSHIAKIIFGLIWFFFLPNTIYILTDLKHLPEDLLYIRESYHLLVYSAFLCFISLGVMTFILGVYPLEIILHKTWKIKNQETKDMLVVVFNFIIAFGVSLGRFQRTNSWHLVTDIEKVVTDVFRTLSSLPLMLFVLAFGIIGNIIYFLARSSVNKIYKKIK